jgi:hypothetical protein
MNTFMSLSITPGPDKQSHGPGRTLQTFVALEQMGINHSEWDLSEYTTQQKE